MSINSLPPELVRVIFENLYYCTDKWTRESDYATLAWRFLGAEEAKPREYVRETKDDTIIVGAELAALKAR